MTQVLADMADSLTQAVVLALLLERSLSLLFAPPGARSRRLPATLAMRLPIRGGMDLAFPLFGIVCLLLAYWLCGALPATPQLSTNYPPFLANGLFALFTTALAGSLRKLIQHAQTQLNPPPPPEPPQAKRTLSLEPLSIEREKRP